MCKFCNPTKKEIKKFDLWQSRSDDGEDYEGVDYMLYRDGKFVIVALFDSGYIGDHVTLQFKFCPMCGRKL